MAKSVAKRFYKSVCVEQTDTGFTVTLDGRHLKTPGKLPFIVDDRKGAALAAIEWEAQGEEIIPSSMPITRLLNVAIEQTPKRREDLIAEARNYAGTDLLCYRKPNPSDFLARQNEQWDPVLKWAAAQGVRLTVTHSLVAIDQDSKALDCVGDFARGLSDIRLTLFVHLVAVYGSAVLAMAVMMKHLDGEAALDLSRLAEIWQIEQWGEDDEAKDRTDTIRTEIKALCQLLET